MDLPEHQLNVQKLQSVRLDQGRVIHLKESTDANLRAAGYS
jgi:hypothetical protein